jgi:hypothetical protein
MLNHHHQLVLIVPPVALHMVRGQIMEHVLVGRNLELVKKLQLQQLRTLIAAHQLQLQQ